MELAGGLLLEGGSCEGRGGETRGFLALEGADGESGPDAVLKELPGLFQTVETGAEGGFDFDGAGGAFRMEDRVHAVVWLVRIRHDLLLAVHDEAQRDGLDASCGELRLDLAPEYRRELEADEAVEHAAGLLRIHEIHVYGAGILDGVLDGVLGDLVEDDALGAGGVEAEGLAKVPGDGLPFTVLIGREPYGTRLRGGFLQFGYHPALVCGDHVLGLETLVHVDTELLILQVADVAETCLYGEILSQIFLESLGFRRGLHDDQILHHYSVKFTN